MAKTTLQLPWRAIGSVVGLVVFSACTGPAPVFETGASVTAEASGKNLSVKWSAARDDDLKHYEVFVDDKLLATTATTHHLLSDLRAWQLVKVRIEAVDDHAQRSTPLATTGRVPDTTPPVFVAKAKWSEDETSISWNAATDDGELAAIRVNVSDSSRPAAKPILAELPPTATSWIVDTTVRDPRITLSACDAAKHCTPSVVTRRPSILAEERRSDIRARIAGKGLLALIGSRGIGGGKVADVFREGSSFGGLEGAFLSTAGVDSGFSVGSAPRGGGATRGIGGGTRGMGGGGMGEAKVHAPRRKDAATGRLRLQVRNVVDADKKIVARLTRQRMRAYRDCTTTSTPTAPELVVHVALAENGRARPKVKMSSGSSDIDACVSRIVAATLFPRRKTTASFDLALRFGS